MPIGSPLAARQLVEMGLHPTLAARVAKVGYDVESLRNAPLEELAKIPGLGESGLRTICRVMGREEEWKRKYDKNYRINGVSIGEIRRYRTLLGTWRYFGIELDPAISEPSEKLRDARRRFDELNISDEQIAEFVLKAHEAKKAGRRVTPSKKRDDRDTARIPELKISDLPKWMRERYEELMARYRETYDVETPNDEASIHSLASMQVSLESIQRDKMALAGAGARDAQSVSLLRILTEQETMLSREMRQLQESLGISKAQRDKREDDASPDQIIRDLIEATKEIRRREIRHIQHKGVLMGIFYTPFPKCFPRKIRIKAWDTGEPIEVELVTDEQLKAYAEALDFSPEGAPDWLITPGVFQE